MTVPITPISTRRVAIEKAIELFEPVPNGSVFYDLGSGAGHMVLAIARTYPEVMCIGIEKYWVPYGRDSWVDAMVEKYHLESTRRSAGRPKKS